MKRLHERGYSIEVAKQLATGTLPDDLKRWPPKQRYTVADFVRRGASQADAVQFVRDDLRDWFERVHLPGHIDRDDMVF